MDGRLRAGVPTGVGALIIAGLCATALAMSLLFGGSTLDDALITFRYARNFADGAGFGVWNVGQPPVEGASSLLWTLILGVGMKLGISPFASSKIIGECSLLGIVLLFGLLARCAARHGDPRTSRAALCAAILAALYVPLARYSVSGMETTLFSLAVAWVVVSVVAGRRGPRWAIADGIVIVLLVLLRPEGVFIGLCLALWKAFFAGRRDPVRFVSLGVLAAAVIAVEGYRLRHFGVALPNTYYAKAVGPLSHFIGFGLSYVRVFALNTWPIWLVVLAGGAVGWKRRQWSRPEVLFALITIGYVAFVLRVGGDPVSAFPLWRHFVHIAPVWLFLAGAAVSRLSRSNAQAMAVSAAIGVLTAGITYADSIQRKGLRPGFALSSRGDAYVDFINRFADRNQLAAVSKAGSWGWYVPIPIIDVLGLNDRHIAHSGKFQRGGNLDSKTDMAYVMARHPTIIDGYIRGSLLRENTCNLPAQRRDMLRGMLESPGFLDTYYFVSNAPYEVVDRAIFVSDTLAEAARSAGAELVGLRETVLGDPDCLKSLE